VHNPNGPEDILFCITDYSGNLARDKLFAYDFAAMRANMRPLREELLYNRMHPDRLFQARHHWLIV
jgi:hypothetical protein